MSHNPGPYTPPKIATRYVNLYPSGLADHHETEAEADQAHELGTAQRLTGKAVPVTVPTRD